MSVLVALGNKAPQAIEQRRVVAGAVPS
jgi:hypothetical protein